MPKRKPSPISRHTFLGAPDGKVTRRTALCVLGLPFDHAVNQKRPISLAPLSIRRQSRRIENGPDGVFPWFFRLDTDKLADIGDVQFDPDASVEEILELLEWRMGAILKHGASPLLLGGAHTVTTGAIAACTRRFGKLALIQFDAHEDIVEKKESALHNGNWVRNVIENGWVSPTHSAQVYVRSCMHAKTESPLKFKIFWSDEACERSTAQLCRTIKKTVGTLPVYISFDIDALDPSCAPGTGNPVFGGPSGRQVLNLLHGLRGINVVAADVVEVSPDLDVRGMTALVGAQIGTNLLYLMTEARNNHFNKGDQHDGKKSKRRLETADQHLGDSPG